MNIIFWGKQATQKLWGCHKIQQQQQQQLLIQHLNLGEVIEESHNSCFMKPVWFPEPFRIRFLPLLCNIYFSNLAIQKRHKCNTPRRLVAKNK